MTRSTTNRKITLHQLIESSQRSILLLFLHYQKKVCILIKQKLIQQYINILWDHSCSYKFCNIHRKTSVLESLFNKTLLKKTPTQLFLFWLINLQIAQSKIFQQGLFVLVLACHFRQVFVHCLMSILIIFK